MKKRTQLLVVAGIFGALGAAPSMIACGTAGDDAASGGADLSAAEAGPDTPVTLAQKRLVGAWLPKSGGSGELAIIFGQRPTQVRMMRDMPHKAVNAKDKQEADRSSGTATVLSVAADGSGKLEVSTSVFIKDTSFTRFEEYDFVFGTEAGNDTLGLTETSARFVPTRPPKDGGAPLPDAGVPDLHPAIQLARTASWCARTLAQAADDCTLELDEGVFKPTDMPPECKGNEELCISCVEHACKTHTVSSCELAGNMCRASVEACEFDNGQPAGQVAEIDTDGKPIDCNGSRRGGGVCCQDLSRGRGDDDDDDR